MVPAVAFGIAQIQKAQAKAPTFVCRGQPYEPVSDEFVLAAALADVVIAGGTDIERLADEPLAKAIDLFGFAGISRLQDGVSNFL